jgi:hypothetical protein
MLGGEHREQMPAERSGKLPLAYNPIAGALHQKVAPSRIPQVQ